MRAWVWGERRKTHSSCKQRAGGWDLSELDRKVRGMVSVLNQFIPIERKSSALEKWNWHFLCFGKGFLMPCWASWALWHAQLATGKTWLCLDTRDIRACFSLYTRASASFTEQKDNFYRAVTVERSKKRGGEKRKGLWSPQKKSLCFQTLWWNLMKLKVPIPLSKSVLGWERGGGRVVILVLQLII